MIVIGADPHKLTHTAAAVDRATGELRGSETVAAREAGHAALLDWARGLDSERVWASEDCRHVSGSLERFLVERGERVVRVPPKLLAGARRSARERGKSDPIDAAAVARAALREGIETLPAAFLDEGALAVKLLLDHREDLVAESTRVQNRLRWHLHDIDPELAPPERALRHLHVLRSLGARLRRREQTVRVRLARELVRRCAALRRELRSLERELETRVRAQAPGLLLLPGCGTLTAAKLIAEIAGAGRFQTDSKLARHAGIAPLHASSGARHRHRFDRRGNRQLNCAFHRIAVTQARIHPEARAFLERKRSEGKSNREALRSLKRHLVRRVHRLLARSAVGSSPPMSSPPTRANAAPAVMPCLT
jgi:transposase